MRRGDRRDVGSGGERGERGGREGGDVKADEVGFPLGTDKVVCLEGRGARGLLSC